MNVQFQLFCGPGEIRTHNSLNANQVLYQLELQAQNTHLTFNSTFTTNYRMSLRVLVNHFSER